MSITYRHRVNTAQMPDGFSLDPLYFAVQFSGSSPSLATPDHLPIEISVHIPNQFSSQFTHSIHAVETTFPPIQDPIRPQGVNGLSPDLFPFFPLPPTFDPCEYHSWQTLAGQIEAHLAKAAHEEHAYMLAHEFFWMAYVAAFPTFPFSNWPAWNPRINMSGDFIAYWITDHTILDGSTLESVKRTRNFIWDEFQTLAVSLLPFSIFF